MFQKNLLPVFLYAIVFGFIACDNTIDEEIIVYENNFESEDDFALVHGASFTDFAGSKVLGNFNNGGFSLLLEDLPAHEYIWIEFDLNIHDTWDGNHESRNGPDFWFMEIDMNPPRDEPYDYNFKTSFSQSSCNDALCFTQAYPQEVPSNNLPRTGRDFAENGLCFLENERFGTSIYRFSEVVRHQNSEIRLRCYDSLKSSINIADPSCDESWSIDNLIVRAVTL